MIAKAEMSSSGQIPASRISFSLVSKEVIRYKSWRKESIHGNLISKSGRKQ